MGTAEDYKVLGLDETASRETVERKYGALLRAYKNRTDEYGATDEDMEYYRKITAAYDNIVGTVHDFSDPNPTSPIPFKVRNFFYKLSANLDHYKFFILGTVLLGVMGVLIFLQVRTVSKDDIHVKFVGAYYAISPAAVEEELNEKTGSFGSCSVSFFSVTVNSSVNDTETANASVAFRVQFTAGSIDMIFIDKDNYDVYAPQYVFLDLTDFLAEHAGDPAFENIVTYSYENKGEGDNTPSGIYGIEFTEQGGRYFENSSMEWLNDEIEGQERSMILCVCRMSKRSDKALAYINELIETQSE